MRLSRILSTVLSLAVMATGASGTTYYVKATGSNSNAGLSWEYPKTLAGAVQVAVAGDEIHVAQGTYTGTFSIPTGIKVLGGYSSDGLHGLDPREYETIIYGGVSFSGCDSDTLFYGFTVRGVGGDLIHCSSSDVTIQDCLLDGWDAVDPINGVYTVGGHPKVVSCRFSACARYCVYSQGGTPTIQGLKIQSDSGVAFCLSGCDGADVGGVHADGNLYGSWYDEDNSMFTISQCSGEIQMRDCAIVNCWDIAAEVWNNSNANILIEDSGFSNLVGYGGYWDATGTFIFGDSCNTTLTMRRCCFSGNQYGGAAVIYADSGTLNLEYTDIENNSVNGSILYLGTATSANLVSCKFTGNANTAICHGGGTLTVANCLIADNSAFGTAGLFNANGTATVINSTICNNHSATAYYTGIYAYCGTVEVANSIMYGNTNYANAVTRDAQVGMYQWSPPWPATTLNVNYCTVSTSISGSWGEGNAVYNPSLPCFVAPESGDYHLASNSQCIDTGSDSYVPTSVTEDLDGRTRLVHAHVDRGAYEGIGSATMNGDFIYVSLDGDDNDTSQGAGLSWTRAFRTLQRALGASRRGDWICVGANGGPYTGSFVIPDGVVVMGGYGPNGAWNFNEYETVIVGSVTLATGNMIRTSICACTIRSNGTGHVLVTMDSTPGTVEDCLLDGSNCLLPSKGIYGYGGTPRVTECSFENATYCAYFDGGTPHIDGLRSLNDNGVAFSLHGCAGATVHEVTANGSLHGSTDPVEPYLFQVDGCTGQVKIDGSNISNCSDVVGVLSGSAAANVYIDNSTFTGNTGGNSAASGGDISFIACNAPNTTVAIRRCEFNSNTLGEGEGGNQSWSGGIVTGQTGADVGLVSCKFNANYGAALYNHGGTTSVTNCLITNNTGYMVGGLYNYSGSMDVANDTVCYNRGHSSSYGGIYAESGAVTVVNSILYQNKGSDYAVTEVAQAGKSTTATLSVSYSVVSDLSTPGVAANWPWNPGFVSGNDYHLLSASPCVDSGSNSGVPDGMSTDIEGKTRIAGWTVDRGAYEYQPPLPPLPPGWGTFYSGTYVAVNEGGTNVVYRYVGGTWIPLGQGGGLPEGSVTCLAYHRGKLYAGVTGAEDPDRNWSTGYIWCYDFQSDQWSDASAGLGFEDGSENEHVHVISAICVNNGDLYASVLGAGHSGGSGHSTILYRSSGTSWVVAATDVWGQEGWAACSFGGTLYISLLYGMAAYDGHLYADNYAEAGGFAASKYGLYATIDGHVMRRSGSMDWEPITVVNGNYDTAYKLIAYSNGALYFPCSANVLAHYYPDNCHWGTFGFTLDGVIEELAAGTPDMSEYLYIKTNANKIYSYHSPGWDYTGGPLLIGQWSNTDAVGPMLVVDNGSN